MGAYVVNLDEYSDIGTHWVDLYAINNNVIYFPILIVLELNIFQKILKYILINP